MTADKVVGICKIQTLKEKLVINNLLLFATSRGICTSALGWGLKQCSTLVPYNLSPGH